MSADASTGAVIPTRRIRPILPVPADWVTSVAGNGSGAAGDPSDRAPGGSEIADAAEGDLASDSRKAVRDTGMIGSSLLVTQMIGFVGGSIVVTRLLGERYGLVAFPESFAQLTMMALNLGVDTYVRKEVPVRPEHARDFAAGVLGVRLLGWAVCTAVGSAVLLALHRPGQMLLLSLLFGIGQLLQHLAETNTAFLQSVGSVRNASLVRVATKILWLVTVIGGLAAGFGLWIVPAAMIVSEGSKAVFLGLLAQRRLRLGASLNMRATWLVLVASLPYLMTHINGALSATLDVAMVGFLTQTAATGRVDEVGLYRAATQLSLVALLLAPVIGWILLPLMSRAMARSEEEFWKVLRRSMEIVMTIAIPLALLVSLNADVIIHNTIGPKFDAAVPALRVLAPMFIVTYVSLVGSSALVRLNRGWFVTRVTLGGVAVNVALNLFLIRAGRRWWGEGGAGLGASISIVVAETIVATAFVAALGARAFDTRTLRSIVITLFAGALVVLLDRLMVPFGAARPFADGALYAGHLIGLRVIRPRELQRLAHGGGFS